MLDEKETLDNEKLVQNYFSGYAAEYYKENYDENEKNCYSYSHPVRKNHILRMIEKFDVKVLDIGCGPGVITLYFLQKGSEVWAVDLSESMVEQAATQIKKTKYKDVAHFSVGNINKLDFKDSFFDIVICSGVFEYLENEELAIKEIHRILKHGGIAIITVPTPQKFYQWFLTFLRSLPISSILSYLKELKYKRTKREYRIDKRFEDYERKFTGKYYDPKQIDTLAINNGFEKIDYAHYHFISLFLSLIAPSLSLYIGERLEKPLYKSKLFGWFGKGYILKAKKI